MNDSSASGYGGTTYRGGLLTFAPRPELLGRVLIRTGNAVGKSTHLAREAGSVAARLAAVEAACAAAVAAVRWLSTTPPAPRRARRAAARRRARIRARIARRGW